MNIPFAEKGRVCVALVFLILMSASTLVSAATFWLTWDFATTTVGGQTLNVPDGQHDVDVGLVDAAGARVWGWERNRVQVTSNKFTHEVGKIHPIDPKLLIKHKSYYWSARIVVNREAVRLDQRLPMVDSPSAFYAINAGHASYSDRAGDADHSKTADTAISAETAKNADNAKEADHSKTADTALTANSATNAENAKNAGMLEGWRLQDILDQIKGGSVVIEAPNHGFPQGALVVWDHRDRTWKHPLRRVGAFCNVMEVNGKCLNLVLAPREPVGLVDVIDSNKYRILFSGSVSGLADTASDLHAARTGNLEPGRFYWLPAGDGSMGEIAFSPFPSGEPPYFLALGPDTGIVLGRRPLPFDSATISVDCALRSGINQQCGVAPDPIPVPGLGRYAVIFEAEFRGDQQQFSAAGWNAIQQFVVCDFPTRAFKVPLPSCDPGGTNCRAILRMEDVVDVTDRRALIAICADSGSGRRIPLGQLMPNVPQVESGVLRVRQLGNPGF